MTRDRQLPPRNFDDEEDASESLSPSDGYFSGRSQLPQNAYVADPSQPNTVSKTQEAGGHYGGPPNAQAGRNNVIYTPSASSQAASSPRFAPEPYHDQSPLLQEPPPGYEAAIADRVPQSQPPSTQASGHSTMNVSEPDVPDSSGPQRMSDRWVVYEGEALPTRGRRRGCGGRRRDRRPRRSALKFLLFFLIGVVFGSWLIGTLIHKARLVSKDQPVRSQVLTRGSTTSTTRARGFH